MNERHIPGPWYTFRTRGTIYIQARLRGSTVQEVAACGPTETPEQQYANARLIAAAPELLAALQSLLKNAGADIVESTDAELEEAISDAECPPVVKKQLFAVVVARAAIAKATGGGV